MQQKTLVKENTINTAASNLGFIEGNPIVSADALRDRCLVGMQAKDSSSHLEAWLTSVVRMIQSK